MIKIGLVAPFEGLYRPIGYQALAAAKLAVRQHNDAGGANGYLIEVVALNDNQDAAVAAQRAREMVVDPDIMGVIGHFGSQTTLAALPVYRQAGLALVVPGATAVEVASKDYSQTFRLGADCSLLGASAAHYAVRERGAMRLAVIRGEEDLVSSFVDMAEEYGAVIVADLDTDDQALLTSLAKTRPEIIFFGGGALDAGELLPRLRGAAIAAPLLGGSALDSAYLVQVAEGAAEGTTYVTSAPPVQDQGFVDAYTALSGALPGPRAALVYDATRLLLNALQDAVEAEGKPTRHGVVAALSQGQQYQGLTGRISFDERGQARDPQVYVYEIVDEGYPGQLVE